MHINKGELSVMLLIYTPHMFSIQIMETLQWAICYSIDTIY